MKNIRSVALGIKSGIARDGLTQIIQSFDGYKVTLRLNDSSKLSDSITQAMCMPDICIVSIASRSIDQDVENFRKIKALSADMKLIIYLSSISKVNVLKLLNIGADCLLPEDSGTDDLKYALDELGNNQSYYSEKIKDIISDSYTTLNLDQTEMSLISLCCSELTYKEIAAKMGLTVRTVEKLRELLFKKFSVVSKTGLVLKALQMQIISIE